MSEILKKQIKHEEIVRSYANGIYILNVTSENGQVYTKKLIKN